ncbi:hypothetical protein TRVL_09722 [Trypanosoma vivax]|nr:hypothetical protein TRVL_09722 [Trypanosoma vivax]
MPHRKQHTTKQGTRCCGVVGARDVFHPLIMYNSLQLRFYANECPRLSRIMKLFDEKENFKKHIFSSIWQQVLIGKRAFTINICSCQRKQFARRSRGVEIAHSADKEHICFMKGLKKASRAPKASRRSAAEIRAQSKTLSHRKQMAMGDAQGRHPASTAKKRFVVPSRS